MQCSSAKAPHLALPAAQYREISRKTGSAQLHTDWLWLRLNTRYSL